MNHWKHELYTDWRTECKYKKPIKEEPQTVELSEF